MKTLVIGASTNPSRYSFLAAEKLIAHHHEIVAIGKEKAAMGKWQIIDERPDLKDIHTVTLYINPKLQKDYYDYIVGLKPKRVIFNPGTENKAFESMLEAHNIEALEACTLVLLSTNQY